MLEALSGPGLHEVFAGEAGDLCAASGFAALAARRAAARGRIVWIRHDALDVEIGRLHAPGLVELGIDPDALALVQARDVAAALKAGEEAARCRGLGAALIELWGESKRVDLTATRRLFLAAKEAGVAVILARAAARPGPSAAWTRWSARALPSRALEAGAPGPPAFAVTLLRHRGGLPPREWHVEWDRDRACFRPREADGLAPASVVMAAVPADRPHAARGARAAG